MTRPFKEKGFTLGRADLSTRVLVTAFLLCVLTGVSIAARQYASRSGGFGPQSAKEWVLGNESDESAEVFRVEKGKRELLAFTHDHIFSLAMVLFVVFHLVQLTPHTQRAKIALILVGFGGLTGTLGVPWWLQRAEEAEGGARALLLIASGSALLASLAIGSLMILAEMWVLPARRRRRGEPEAPAANPMFPEGDARRSKG